MDEALLSVNRAESNEGENRLMLAEETLASNKNMLFTISKNELEKLFPLIGCPTCFSHSAEKEIIANGATVSIRVTCQCGNFSWESRQSPAGDAPTTATEERLEGNNETIEENTPQSVANNPGLSNNRHRNVIYIETKTNGVYIYRLRSNPSLCYVFRLRHIEKRSTASNWLCIGCDTVKPGTKIIGPSGNEEVVPTSVWKYSIIKIDNDRFLKDPEEVLHCCKPKNFLDQMYNRLRIMTYQGIKTSSREIDITDVKTIDIFKKQVDIVLREAELTPEEKSIIKKRLHNDPDKMWYTKRKIQESQEEKNQPEDEHGPSFSKKGTNNVDFMFDVVEFASRRSNLAAQRIFNVSRGTLSHWLQHKQNILIEKQRQSIARKKLIQTGNLHQKAGHQNLEQIISNKEQIVVQQASQDNTLTTN